MDREAMRNAALADWREFRRSLDDDDDEARCYAELVGWMAQRDPIALAEFTAHQRRYMARTAAERQGGE